MLLKPFKESVQRVARINRGRLESVDIRAILSGDRESKNIDRRLMETIKHSINLYPTFGASIGLLTLLFFHIGWDVIFIYFLGFFLSIRFFTKKAMKKWLEELLAKAEENKNNKSAMYLNIKNIPVYIDLEMLSDTRQEESK